MLSPYQREKLQKMAEDRNPALKMQRMLHEASLADAISKMELAKGAPGYTPVKGKDYFTADEIDAVVAHLRSLVKDGKPGEKGQSVQGPRGDAGETPKKGVHYWTKEDQKKILKDLAAMIPEVKVPTIQEVASRVPLRRISYSEIMDAPDLADLPKLIEFLKRGGFRGGGSSSGSNSGGTVIDNEVVAGSGTTFTLAFSPIAGSVKVYALGQRLTLTTDYTIAGQVITTVSSWLAGQILADYRTT